MIGAAMENDEDETKFESEDCRTICF